MEKMILISLVSNIMVILAFYIGFKCSQATKQQGGQQILNPVKVVKEQIINSKISKEMQEEQNRIDIQMANIDTYDGTSKGQKDIG